VAFNCFINFYKRKAI